METSASFEARSAPSPYPSDPLGLESCAATARDTAKRRQRIGGVGDRASKRCNPDADVFVMRLAAGLLGGHLMTDGRESQTSWHWPHWPAKLRRSRMLYE